MKLSMNWLSEFVRVDADAHAYAAAMTMSGSKVETVSYLGSEIENVVVGHVLSVDRHPDADKLVICRVDVGTKTLQIVTGAPNVRANDYVPVAYDGARLPGGVEIHTGKLRGVESAGMLCSYQELGLTQGDVPGADEHGILILHGEGLVPGADIRPLLGFDDTVVEFEITPNRPDCLSVIGLARETAATYDIPFAPPVPAVKGSGAPISGALSVRVEDAPLCSRYTARLVRGVKIGPSPAWLRHRLRASGVRPINNIVDITNYVMLEYGQPLHAFDYACLAGGEIVVRRARAGETLETLDGQQRKLDDSMLVIADSSRPVGVAGVMGGANSEITDKTVDVVFESANFDGTSVRLSARRLGMRTEASGRFEKGLDSRNVLPALERACALVELLGAGEVAGGLIDVDAGAGVPAVLPFDAEKIAAAIGAPVTRAQMERYFTLLGFGVADDTLTVPSWRADVEGFADLVEEAARLYGYDKIPTTLYAGATRYAPAPRLLFDDRVREVCTALGFDEAQTFSFVGSRMFDRLRLPADSPLRSTLTLLNPLGEDMSQMRTTAVGSMAELLCRNYNMKNQNVRLFETARVYLPAIKDGKPDPAQLANEPRRLILGAYGEQEDFFSLKGAVEAVAAAFSVKTLRFEAERANPSFHPGRTAKVYIVKADGSELYWGVAGQLHPEAAENFGADAALYIAELSADALFSVITPLHVYKPLPRFPAVTRDLAVLCAEEQTAGEVEACIRAGAGALLEDVTLFDVYRGPQVGEGKKSLAFALTLRAPDRTLTDTDADAAVNGALARLSEVIGAVLRV